MSVPRKILWTAADAAAATGGRATAAWEARGISIDSRTIEPGDLFIALSGPNFDGHTFVADALERGAVAAMVKMRPDTVPTDAPLLLVEDTLTGLTALATAARSRTAARVIGVTGSVGKTGVKDALRLVLGNQGETVASRGNLNNHWGLPLSLARLPADAAFGVLEMGMNHAGEIAPLARLARPDVAVITTVEAVHRAHFASVAAIADAKAEIFQGLAARGAAVLFRDNPQFDRLAAAASAHPAARIVSFGRHPDADVRVVEAQVGAEGSHVRAAFPGGTVTYHVPVAGPHWVINSLCVLASVWAVGADLPAAAAAFAGFTEPKGRGQRHRVTRPDGVLTVIDDSYNASPVSVAASLAVLARSTPGPGGRRIAVLGDMLELGEDAPALHAALAAPLRDYGVDRVYTAGPLMAHLFEALPASLRGEHADSAEVLAPRVTAGVHSGDVVVIKGSAGSRMGIVVAALLQSGDASKAMEAPPRAASGG